MLKQRIITAVVVAPIALALVLWAPGWLFAAAMTLLVLVGAWEWSALAGYPSAGARAALTAGLAALLFIYGWAAGVPPQGTSLLLLCLAALAWWLFSLCWLALWRVGFPRPVKLVCGLLTLLPALAAVVALRAAGLWYLLVLLFLIWAADIGAYFAGRAFGRNKLAPAVSPGKTWEGVACGAVAAAAVAGAACLWLPVPPAAFILVSMCVALLSVVGDLSESLFKRQAGVKDSGRLFPGHGGVLDRIDSLTAAAPLFWLGLHGLGLAP